MVIIAGGGLSGLTAAFYLRRAGIPFRLFEPQPRLGGVMLTERSTASLSKPVPIAGWRPNLGPWNFCVTPDSTAK